MDVDRDCGAERTRGVSLPTGSLREPRPGLKALGAEQTAAPYALHAAHPQTAQSSKRTHAHASSSQPAAPADVLKCSTSRRSVSAVGTWEALIRCCEEATELCCCFCCRGNGVEVELRKFFRNSLEGVRPFNRRHARRHADNGIWWRLICTAVDLRR